MIEFRQIDLITLISAVFCAGGLYVLWGRKRSGWLFAWRALNACALLLAVLQPKLVSYVKDTRPVIAVAADASRSMKMTGRSAAVQKFMLEYSAGMEKRFRLKSFAFSSELNLGF